MPLIYGTWRIPTRAIVRTDVATTPPDRLPLDRPNHARASALSALA